MNMEIKINWELFEIQKIYILAIILGIYLFKIFVL